MGFPERSGCEQVGLLMGRDSEEEGFGSGWGYCFYGCRHNMPRHLARSLQL